MRRYNLCHSLNIKVLIILFEIKKFIKGTNNLWLMRLYYLVYYMGTGAINPFINLFYIDRGLSGTEIGLLTTIGSLSGMVAAPVWGRLNDSARRPRLLLQIALCINSAAYFLISRQTIFLNMAIIIGLNALVISGVDPLMSSQALSVARESDAGFGSIRLWGSMGWALAAPISGWIIQHTNLLSVFYEYITMLLLSTAILFLIKTSNPQLERVPSGEVQPRLPLWQVLREFLKNRELVALLIASVAVWIGTNGTKFESVYLQQLGAGESVIGWVNTIGAVVEMPMMLLADRVLRRTNPTFTLRIGYLVYVFALAFVVIHPSVATILIYRALGGVGLGFYVVSFTQFIAQRAPAGQTATALALYSVTFAGVVNILISPVNGMIFDLAGAYWLYVQAMIGYTLAFVIMYFAVVRKRV